MCNFVKAWIGKCQAGGGDPCQEHSALVCDSCGKPATHECGETGQFVCGANLCDDCEHAIAPDGSNGGVGFYTTVPQEMRATWKGHVPKGTQKYLPWYER